MKERNLASVRDFLRNFKKYAEGEEEVFVVRNGKNLGTFVPAALFEKLYDGVGMPITDEMINAFTFKGPGDMSENIDAILYDNWKKGE